MDDNCGGRPRLGSVLVTQGALEGGALDQALRAQEQTGERLGEFLLRLGLICRPELDRAMAQQAGTELAEESGFGTGLRAEIERRHGWRREVRAAFR
jgi:phage tail sheath protein FI